MKKLILSIATFVTLITSSYSQSFPNLEFSSRPYFLLDDNTLGNLERADATIESKLKGMGYGGVESYYTAFSSKSGVRYSNNTLPKIIIKIEDNIDPADIISLSVGEIKKDRRRFLQRSMKLGGAARDVSTTNVALEFTKISEGIYEIKLPTEIRPGEYAFMPIGDAGGNPLLNYNTKVKISCFGID
jgi:hypothetical protein